MMAQAVEAQARLPAGSVPPEDVFDLRLQAARPLYATGDIAGFTERIRDAQSLAETLGDRRRLATAYIHACESLRTEHEHQRAIAAGEAGLDLAIEIGDQGLQDQANFQLGLVYRWRGDHAQALTYFEVATASVPHLRPGIAVHLVPYIPGLGSRVMSLAALGRFAEAWPLAREAVRLVGAGAQPAAYPFATLGTLCVLQGRFDEAVSHLEQALEQCRERGFQVVRATCTAALAEAFALSGRRPEALTVLEETAEWYASPPVPAHRSGVLTRLGHALLVVGRTEDARRFGARALDMATRSGERGVEASVRQLLAEVALYGATAPGDHEAERQFRDALLIADEIGLRPLAAHCHAGLGRLHQCHAKPDQAQQHLTTAVAMYREMGMAPWLRRTEEVARNYA
jgi:tetratricopeptide (TPR) repeat protein